MRISELNDAQVEPLLGNLGKIDFTKFTNKFEFLAGGSTNEKIRSRLQELGYNLESLRGIWYATKPVMPLLPIAGALPRSQGQNPTVQKSDTTLFELQRKYNAKLLVEPTWQRGINRWTLKRREKFIKEMISATEKFGNFTLESVVTLYTRPSSYEDERIFINDGLQRVSNGVEIFKRLSDSYGPDEAQRRLEKIIVTSMNWIQDDKQARQQYCRLNQGTALTSGELSKTILTTGENYSDWLPVFVKTQSIIREVCEATLGCEVTKQGNGNSSYTKTFVGESFEREAMAMLYRFLYAAKSRKKLEFKPSHLLEKTVEDPDLVETAMCRVMASISPTEALKKLNQLKPLLAIRAAVWRNTLNNVHPNGYQSTFAPALAKFMLYATIHYENNEILAQQQNEWFKALIKLTHGTTKVSSGTRIDWISSNDLRSLVLVESQIGSIDPLAPSVDKPGRKSQKIHLRPGNDNSHIQPVAATGYDSGITFPESSSENRSRGAYPVEIPSQL